MIPLIRAAASAAVFFFALAAAASAAGPWTLTVPIRISSVPAGVTVDLTCNVSGSVRSSVGVQLNGFTTERLSLDSAGSFSGTKTIVISDAHPSPGPYRYQCFLTARRGTTDASGEVANPTASHLIVSGAF
jgi:hypothetical protein